ncbi:MAG: hypothetical protein QF807_05775 [Candidatus Thalassarchaeaceae archaeon]|jgi:hypothetical protein|nr:hypothetical protein [Candidatus Thalassarchaeaceae archaeon]
MKLKPVFSPRIVAMILVILLYSLSPIAINDLKPDYTNEPNTASARAVEPDVNITSIEWLGPSYYCTACGSDFILATGAQQIRVTLQNDGLAIGAGSVTFYVNDGMGGGFVLISSQPVNMLPGAVTQHIFGWTATAGAIQTVRAFATVTSDSEPSNNILELDYDVQDINAGDVYSDTLPINGTRLAHENAVVSVGVRNAGNVETNTTALITLTPILGGGIEYFSSTTQTLSTGSVAEPPAVEILPIVIDGASLSGTYELGGSVYFNSTTSSSSDIIPITPRDVTFSQYRSSIVPPSDRAVEPGGSTTMTFMVQNIGELPDRYNITISDNNGWSNSSTVPAQTSVINASSSEAVLIPVTVPLGTNRSESDVITIQIESVAEGYFIQSSSTVMAGDILQGTLNRSNWNIFIVPGTEEVIQYTLKNTGTSPAIFDLSTGFEQVAPGWTASIYPITTPYLTVDEEIVVTVTVNPPSLSMPFDPTTKLAEGNQLSLWTSVIPQGGGSPNVQHTTLEVQPTVMVELIAPETEFTINLTEIESGPISRFVNIDMQLRHNLMSNLSSTVDISLNIAPNAFTPTRSGSGSNEIQRWNSSVSPNNVSMQLGATQALVATILGPSDLLPLAGNLNIDVVANLTLSGALSSGIKAPDTVLSLLFSIPELSSAEIEVPDTTIIIPEISSSVDVNITNTGNHRINFTFEIEGPDGWTVSVLPTSTTNVGSTIDNWPSIGNDNTSVNVSVTAPPNARADTIPDITLNVLGEDGQIITQANIPFVVQELINAYISPSYIVAVVPISSNSSIALEANNSGNSQQEFTIAVEHSFVDINMTITSNTSMIINPGEVSIVQIEVSVGQFARADVNHTAQVVLYHEGTELSRIDAYIEIIPNHQIEFEHYPEYSVVPGMNLSILVNVTNMGNIIELINFTTISPTGWVSVVRPQNLTIDAEGVETLPIVVDVTVPPMEQDAGLEPGSVHNITLIATNVTDDIQSGVTSIIFNVEPIFVLSSDDFPDLVELLPGESRTFDIDVSNDGNQNVSLDITCQITPSNRWLVSDCDISNFTLDSGAVRSVSFTVQSIASNHYNGEEADFSITFSPQDNHSGDAMLVTKLKITRMRSSSSYELSGGQRVHDIEINWMHVQAVGQTADTRSISYQFNITNMSRYIDEELYPGNVDWEFWIDYGDGFVPLDDYPFTIPPASPLVLKTMKLRAQLPATENIPPGDGWLLQFQLQHPEELTNTTVNFDIQVDAWADPAVISLNIDDFESFTESKTGTISATIKNGGNAGTALGVVTTLHCNSGITIIDEPTIAIISLSPFESRDLNWGIHSEALEWWESEETVECDVTIESPYMEGDSESNDIMSKEFIIKSWSLPLLLLIPISITLIGTSSRLLRRAVEDERSLMLSAYSATILLGVATHFNLGMNINILLAVTSLLWVALITSRSANFEIPAILSDRQNKQRGNDSVIEDHDAEINRVIKQLIIKLSFAPLGFIFATLLMPYEISWSLFNICTVLLYAIIGAAIVFFTINLTLYSWQRIFDNLSLLEIESQELLQQLGSPSTDLRRITIGQRWGEAHGVNIEVDENV